MIGSVIGDLAAWTWEHDRECFYKRLVSPDAKLSGYGHLVLSMWRTINEGGLIHKNRFYPSCVRNTGCYYPWERENFNRLLSECKLVDTFRTLHPDERKYTYFDTIHGVDYRATNQGSRLDYFLVSESLMSDVIASEILSPLSAPSNPIMLEIEMNQNTLLNNKKYDEFVRTIANGYQNIMQMAIREYTPLVTDICQRTASSNEVEHLLDYMFDFVGNDKMLPLYKQVCRCYFDKYPEMIAWHIMEYRKEYDRESLIGTKYEYLLHEDDESAEDV